MSTDYFLGIKEFAMRKESETSEGRGGKSSVFSDDSSCEYDKVEFYNNNYWKNDVMEIDFEIA